MEIEKKYLIKKLPDNLDKYECKHIIQAYLCTAPVLRIRKSNDRYILTYKMDMSKEATDKVRINNEIEADLTKDSFEHLLEKADGRVIEKFRYNIPLDDGHMAELDIFKRDLEGIIFTEVEFENEEAALSFQSPEWFDENVSENQYFFNSFLSSCSVNDVNDILNKYF